MYKNNTYIYLFLFPCSFSSLFSLFSNPSFNLGFNSTSNNYYTIIINIIILLDAQTYKLQYDAFSFILVSLVLIDHSQHVCSFYDANEAQEIEEISLLFFVYNLSVTNPTPLKNNLVLEI